LSVISFHLPKKSSGCNANALMATPTDVAIVHTDHEFEKPQPGQRRSPSPIPLNATVEDYTSEEETNLKDRKRKERLDLIKKDLNEPKDHQRKSTIRVSTLPKQVNVSWYDRPVSHSKSQASSNKRGSMFSQASTLVPHYPVVPPYPYPYEDLGPHNAYDSTSNRDRVYQYPVPNPDNVVASWDRLRHAVPSPKPSRSSGPPAPTDYEPSSLAVSKQSLSETQAHFKEAFANEGAKMSAKFEEFLQNFQQTLNQHSEEQRTMTASGRTSLAPTTSATEEETLTDLDLIKAMEERIQGLKRKNEEKLIEANQVLRYLAQRSKPEQRDDENESVSSHISGARVTYANVPMVYRYQTLEEDSTSEDAGETSVDSHNEDSIAGNSSGSSISSLAPRFRQIQPLSVATGRQDDRKADPESVDSDDDESISCTKSGDDLTVGREEPESSNARVEIIEDSEHGVVRSAVTIAELDMMGELISLRRDLQNLKRQTQTVGLFTFQSSSLTYTEQENNNNSWFGHAIRSSLVQFRKHFRQLPIPGRQRLEWTCVSSAILSSTLNLTVLGMRRSHVRRFAN
jgi:hypothetical protein